MKKVLFFIIICFFSCTVQAFSADLRLLWDAASGEVTGYRIYYGTASGSHPNMIDVGNTTSFTVTGLESGTTYYFVCRAYNQYGESGDSDEITWSAPVNDIIAPTIQITSPTTDTYYDTNLGTINLAGTASDNVKVSDVTWENTVGSSGIANGTVNWTINGINLVNGENVIIVTAKDSSGNISSDSITVNYSAQSGNISITDVESISPSNHNVIIKWKTNVKSNSMIEYGIDSNYDNTTAIDTDFTTTHYMILTGLQSGTTYHYRVISKDESDDTAISNDYIFMTLDSNSTWNNDDILIEAEDGIINTPMQIENDTKASSGKYITVPSGTGIAKIPHAEAIYTLDIRKEGDYCIWILINGLTANNDALYVGVNGSFDRVFPDSWGNYLWVRVETVNNSGNYIHHLNKGINHIAIGHREELARADRILITSDPNFIPDYDITGTGDTTPPGDVTGFTADPGPEQVALSWTNPTDSDFAGVMIRFRTDGTYPQNYMDGTAVPNGNNGKITGSPGAAGSYVHSGLDPNLTYYYSIFTYDTAGNYSHTAHAYATPLPTPPANQAPSISSFSAAPNPADNPRGNINFTVQASDPDGDTLTYTIDFGDGSSSTSGSSVTHAYTAQGTYTAKATVSDGQGHSVDKTLQIKVNDNAPAKVTGVKAQLN